MRRLLRAVFGALIKLTSVTERSVAGGGKPCIYIANSIDTRAELATFYALERDKTCLLVSSREYSEKAALRTVSRRHIIAAQDGISTEWLHAALRHIKGGESILLFPDNNDGVGAVFTLLSLLSGADIVPLYSRAWYGPLCTVRVTAGEPLRPDTAAALTAQQVRRENERAIASLSALAGTVRAGGAA